MKLGYSFLRSWLCNSRAGERKKSDEAAYWCSLHVAVSVSEFPNYFPNYFTDDTHLSTEGNSISGAPPKSVQPQGSTAPYSLTSRNHS